MTAGGGETAGTINLVVDCDAGVDDLFGVALAARHPRCRLLAVSVVGGNVPTREGVHFVRTVLDLAERSDVAVLPGLEAGRAPGHGDDEDAGASIATALRDVIDAADGPTAVAATGSLTNVAVLLKAFPQVATSLSQVTFLGGAFHYPGNASPLAERNVFSDPDAAADVFTSGAPVTLVPINVSGTFDIPADVGEALSRGGNLLHEYLWAILGPLRSYYSVVFGAGVCPIHDPLAVLLALAPHHFDVMRAEVAIELKGDLTRGTTVVDLRPEAELANQEARTSIVRDVDAAAAWKEIADVLGLAPVSPGG